MQYEPADKDARDHDQDDPQHTALLFHAAVFFQDLLERVIRDNCLILRCYMLACEQFRDRDAQFAANFFVKRDVRNRLAGFPAGDAAVGDSKFFG